MPERDSREQIAERKRTREQCKPLLALIKYGFKSLPSDNAKRAYLATIKRAVYELESTVVSKAEMDRRQEFRSKHSRDLILVDEDGSKDNA